ncbi:pollen receptor-like kinase 1 [Pistacia vera]|uniref:pollen receptor-like kinase 1 n=1 Tax=Pistacia vera TaxID=55513 RepID=UPI001262EB6F|nr:pollen receptor-like kinase 1 [Pistacia vera]
MTLQDKPLFLLLFLHLMTYFLVACFSLSDSEILVNFKSSLSDSSSLYDWDDETSPCDGNDANWFGVLCNKGSIWGLKLENMGLKGKVEMSNLAELKDLRTISLMNNEFEGPIPDLSKLSALKSVYLSHNKFSGDIPRDEFEDLTSLKKLYLADNNFSGAIPSSLTSLSKLRELSLEGNQFEGEIPDFQQNVFQVFNVSNNALTGPIPPSLQELDPSSFSGNKGLCGGPLDSCDGTKSERKDNTATLTIIIFSIVAVVALAAILATLFILRRRKQEEPETIESPLPSNFQKKSGIRESEQPSTYSQEISAVGGKKSDQSTKLSFVRDDREKFDLQGLLRSSAEILGSGCFGSSYKASLGPGAMMVVKRFKQMNNVGREDFQEHMRRLGRLRHANLLPLVAYYYRKEEKLLVSDFVQRGSLAVHLHGRHSMGQPSLDWPTRLKIIKGVSKGLAYLYKELPSLIAPHGHLKSSNVLLKESFEPLLSDYGLIPVINQESAQDLMVAYKSPESLQYGRITKKTDVWGLGVLILEILTGKFPANFLQQGKRSEIDLANWVMSIVGNGNYVENKSQVYDKDMGGTKNSEGEMNKLLKIGLACCEAEVEKRLELKEAVERIEELKEKDMDDDFYSSYASEADLRSSRGKSDDFSSYS